MDVDEENTQTDRTIKRRHLPSYKLWRSCVLKAHWLLLPKLLLPKNEAHAQHGWYAQIDNHEPIIDDNKCFHRQK